MCYEFSEWFTKVRATGQVRKQAPKTEEPATQPPRNAPETQPTAPETPVKEREAAPA
jgi:hypothetical protein